MCSFLVFVLKEIKMSDSAHSLSQPADGSNAEKQWHFDREHRQAEGQKKVKNMKHIKWSNFLFDNCGEKASRAYQWR